MLKCVEYSLNFFASVIFSPIFHQVLKKDDRLIIKSSEIHMKKIWLLFILLHKNLNNRKRLSVKKILKPEIRIMHDNRMFYLYAYVKIACMSLKIN